VKTLSLPEFGRGNKASAVLATALCPFVRQSVRYKLVFSRNSWTDRAPFLHTGHHRFILHSVLQEFGYLKKTRVLATGTLSQILDLENFRHGTSTVASVVLRQTEYQLTHIFLWYQRNVSYTCYYGYRLVVLDAGRVCECDSPTALLDDTNTRFYAMAKDAGIVTWSRHV